jgi:hypothetical protein
MSSLNQSKVPYDWPLHYGAISDLAVFAHLKGFPLAKGELMLDAICDKMYVPRNISIGKFAISKQE